MEHSFNKKLLAEQGLEYCDVCKQGEIELEKECHGNSIRVGAEVSDDFCGDCKKQFTVEETKIYHSVSAVYGEYYPRNKQPICENCSEIRYDKWVKEFKSKNSR